MMGDVLRIAHATFYQEEDFSIIFFCADADCHGFRLELSRADEFDEQDVRNGEDTYCLCTEDGQTWYGGIEKITVGTGRIEFRLQNNAAAALGFPTAFTFELLSPAPDLRHWIHLICPELEVAS